MILSGKRHMRYVACKFVEHYLVERLRQRLGNRRLTEPPEPAPTEGEVLGPERLGGLLRSYYRRAA